MIMIMTMIMIITMTIFNGQRLINWSPLDDKITNLMKKLTATMKISKSDDNTTCMNTNNYT